MRMAMLVALALLAVAGLPVAATAQPVLLFERGTPAPAALHDPATNRYAVPAGNWQPYIDWLRSGAPANDTLMAIIDSGILPNHPFIAPVLAEAVDLTGEGADDRVGHGTTVALLAIMTGGNAELGFPRLLSIKVHGGAAQAGADRMAQSLAIAAQRGARIANVSAGVFTDCLNRRDPEQPAYYVQPCDEQPICRAVQAAKEKGMLVVAAVGNDPKRTACPACCGDAIAVGAAGSDGQPAPYTGRFPDILAPGNVEMIPLLRSQ
jgi:subtilisin family serine protease